MSEAVTATRRSPLHHRRPVAATGEAVRIAERPFLGKFILRADPGVAGGPLRDALGLELPYVALTSASSGDTALLWMGPDEWMLVTAPDDGAARFAAASGALTGTHHQLTDVTDYYMAIDLEGPKSRELLMKLTTLDLHPRAFRAGMVTGAVFGRANATIWLRSADESGASFRLFVRWSMADYLWCVLAECGREWGVPEQVPLKGERLTIE